MLEIKELCVSYKNKPTVRAVNFKIEKREILGIVGESGSGKSTIINSILGLLGTNGQITGGEIIYDGLPLSHMSTREKRRLRGRDMALVPQHPESFLDPVFTIGYQMYETIASHRKIKRREADEISCTILRDLDLEDAEKIINAYPFELSGGMCQRVAIAMALLNDAKILLADEPTSALDATVQKNVMKLLLKVRERHQLSMLVVSHNIGLIAQMADKVLVMQDGRVVEYGSKEDVIYHPKHDYTKMLLASVMTYPEQKKVSEAVNE